MQELKNKDAAVVVFSGGQDSTTCLFWALKRYKKVIASETCKRIRVCKENLP